MPTIYNQRLATLYAIYRKERKGHARISVPTIVASIGGSRATIHRYVNWLIEEGYVYREMDEFDKLRTTDKGRKFLQDWVLRAVKPNKFDLKHASAPFEGFEYKE